VKNIFLNIVFILFGALAIPLSSDDSYHLHAGYILEGTSSIAARDVQLGYEFLAKRYNKKYNITVEMAFYPKKENAISLFEKGNLDYIGMPFAIFASSYSRFKPYLSDIFISSTTDAVLEPFVTLVSQTEGSSISLFRGKKAVFEEEDSNAIVYADMITMKYFHNRYSDQFEVNNAPSAQRAILMLYFHQADIAFVPLRSWETAKMMNPSLEKKIKMVDTSPPVFGYGIELYHNRVPQKLHTLNAQMNHDLITTEDGKQLLRIMKAKQRILIEPNQIESYIGYYLQYQNLLKQYKGMKK